MLNELKTSDRRFSRRKTDRERKVRKKCDTVITFAGFRPVHASERHLPRHSAWRWQAELYRPFEPLVGFKKISRADIELRVVFAWRHWSIIDSRALNRSVKILFRANSIPVLPGRNTENVSPATAKNARHIRLLVGYPFVTVIHVIKP